MTQEIRSIPLKFWLPASLLAVLLIYGVLSLVIYGHWREVAHRDEHWRFWSQAVAVMQQEFGLALLSDDQAGIQRVITSYGVDPALRVLAVEMPDGRVTHANQLAWRGRLASEVLPDYLGGVTSEILQLESGGQHRLASVADLPGAEGSAARLHFSYELGHHPAQLLAIFDRFSIGMFLLFLLLVVAPLLWALRRYVERPLSGLVKLVDEVGSSDGLKLDVRGRGEVARVAHALAGMSQAIVENMAALTKSERYLSDILEYNPVCIWIKDLKGRVTYVNRASEEFVGLPRGEIVGQLDVDLWPDEAESMREHDQLIITSGRADQFLQRLTAEGGRIHWGLTTQFPLKDASGAVYAVGSIRVDTTEQEQLRQQLIRRKARLEKISGMAMRLTGDPLEVMPQIAEMMSQFLGCRGAGILQVRGDQMLPLALRIDGVAYPERPPLPLVPGGVIAEAVASRTPRAVDKFHGTYRDSPLAQFTDLRCAHVHPVIDKSDAIIATLFILDDTPIRLSEEEQELMGIIALRVALEMARWRAQRAARLTEQRYRTLMELTATGYVLVDARGRVLEANEQYCKFTGRDQLDQIVGRCVSEWTPDEAWPELKSILQEVGTSGEGWSGMVEFEQPDHTRRPLMVQSSYIDNEQGRTPFALVWDATEQMAAEKMQLQHEQRLQSLIDSMQEGVISIDQRGIILSFNPAAGQMFGYEAVDVIGTKVNRLMPAEYAKTYDDYLQRYLNGGETHIFGIPRELKAVRANGQEFPIRLLVSEVIGAGPERQFVGSVTDLSEVVLREEMLRRSQKMEAVGQLSGGIAHDFNNQLGVVLGYLDFLGEELRHQEKPSQWVDTATRAARRCVELTRQLLAFSRRRVLDESQVLDVNATIEEMQGLIQRSLTPGIELDLRLAAGCWRVRCDRGELQDVLLNLALNARDAMPDGGALRIQSDNQVVEVIGEASGGVLEPGEYVHLVVEDSGTGMTDEALEHLFEPFFTTKPEGEGTGLGMAMVWGFVQRSGGQINVSSQPGQGTRVSIYLPRCRPESGLGLSAAEIPEPSGAALPRGNERVLVVDDEPMLRELASSYLQHLGYRTLEAENGRQALAILASDERLDLVFSDVIMPGGVDGFAVAEAASQRQLPPKVLLASGFLGQGNDRDRAGQLAGALLDKPYDIAALARAVRRVLDD